MVTITEITQQKELYQLKEAYFNQANAPLDGMWHFGFVPMSQHFGFFHHDNLIGFCCINQDRYLLQFYLGKEPAINSAHLFETVIQGESPIGKVKGAFASTAEPHYFSLCLDLLPNVQVNSLMYQQIKIDKTVDNCNLTLTLATQNELGALVAFAFDAIGAPKEWLSQYYGNLIKREELWYYSTKQEIIATGECRYFDDFQRQFADLGVIVATNHRGQGLATAILKKLAQHANRKNLLPICSTEATNIAAQKAINNAGFYAPNRIVKFE